MSSAFKRKDRAKVAFHPKVFMKIYRMLTFLSTTYSIPHPSESKTCGV